jgi:hypothetical protein
LPQHLRKWEVSSQDISLKKRIMLKACTAAGMFDLFDEKYLSQTPKRSQNAAPSSFIRITRTSTQTKEKHIPYPKLNIPELPHNTVDHSSEKTMSPLLINQSAQCSPPLSILLLPKNCLHSLPNLLFLPHLLLLFPPLLRSIHDPAKRPLPITIL